MKKSFKLYLIAWAILLIVYNVIAIVSPGWATLEKHTPSFWIGYAFSIVAFVGQLICAWLAFRDNTIKKTFYNFSMFNVSYSGTIATFTVAILCMIISPLPYWVAAIICPLVLAINTVAVIKTKMAIDLVVGVDEKVERATAFIYDMREESESLLAKATADEAKTICKKVRDAFKFSDPMSNPSLASIEIDIQGHFELLTKAIKNGEIDVATSESEELLALILERNNKCKRLK
jgi:hypothetical protein